MFKIAILWLRRKVIIPCILFRNLSVSMDYLYCLYCQVRVKVFSTRWTNRVRFMLMWEYAHGLHLSFEPGTLFVPASPTQDTPLFGSFGYRWSDGATTAGRQLGPDCKLALSVGVYLLWNGSTWIRNAMELSPHSLKENLSKFIFWAKFNVFFREITAWALRIPLLF